MLELSSIQAVNGSVHCQVKNMECGDPEQGFTLYEGPIELALTNIFQRTFRATKTSLMAAYECFKFMRTDGQVFNHAQEIEAAFKVLLDGTKPLLVSDIIDRHFLPGGLRELLYPHVRCHECPAELLPVLLNPKPIVRKDTLVCYLENRTLVLGREQVLYYRT